KAVWYSSDSIAGKYALMSQCGNGDWFCVNGVPSINFYINVLSDRNDAILPRRSLRRILSLFCSERSPLNEIGYTGLQIHGPRHGLSTRSSSPGRAGPGLIL